MYPALVTVKQYLAKGLHREVFSCASLKTGRRQGRAASSRLTKIYIEHRVL